MPHILQPKHIILKENDAKELLEKYNISLSQLPKIKLADPALPKGAVVGDIIKIERKSFAEEKPGVYFRAVVL